MRAGIARERDPPRLRSRCSVDPEQADRAPCRRDIGGKHRPVGPGRSVHAPFLPGRVFEASFRSGGGARLPSSRADRSPGAGQECPYPSATRNAAEERNTMLETGFCTPPKKAARAAGAPTSVNPSPIRGMAAMGRIIPRYRPGDTLLQRGDMRCAPEHDDYSPGAHENIGGDRGSTIGIGGRMASYTCRRRIAAFRSVRREGDHRPAAVPSAISGRSWPCAACAHGGLFHRRCRGVLRTAGNETDVRALPSPGSPCGRTLQPCPPVAARLSFSSRGSRGSGSG